MRNLALILMLVASSASAQTITLTTTSKAETLVTADAISVNAQLNVAAVENLSLFDTLTDTNQFKLSMADTVLLSDAAGVFQGSNLQNLNALLADVCLTGDSIVAGLRQCGIPEYLATGDAVTAAGGTAPPPQSVAVAVDEQGSLQDSTIAITSPPSQSVGIALAEHSGEQDLMTALQKTSVPASLAILSVSASFNSQTGVDSASASWQDAPANGSQWWKFFNLSGSALASGVVSSNASGRYSVSVVFVAPVKNSVLFGVCDNKNVCKYGSYLTPVTQ